MNEDETPIKDGTTYVLKHPEQRHEYHFWYEYDTDAFHIRFFENGDANNFLFIETYNREMTKEFWQDAVSKGYNRVE